VLYLGVIGGMTHPNTKFLRAVGTMVGSIVGVGVFGLPYVFAQSGFVVGAIWLLVLAVLLTTLQLMYAEVCVQTGDGGHRLVGFVEEYLGKRWRPWALAALAGTLWGAMLAYLIVGGHFLHLLFGTAFGGPEELYALLLAAVVCVLVWRGLGFVSKIEVWIIGALLFLFAFMTLAALPHVEIKNLFVDPEWHQVLLPFGVVLFSLAGVGVVPEMKDILGRKQQSQLPRAVLTGMVIITLIYLAFSAAVVGATGANTSQIAFDSLVPVLGGAFAVVGSVLGAMTVFSIYMILGIELQNTFLFDIRLSRWTSFTLTMGVPIVLYLAGVRTFIDVVGVVGGVFAAFLGILIVLMYEKMRKSPTCNRHKCLKVPHVVSWIIIAVFTASILVQFFFR